MARSIKWIDVGIDADVSDGESSSPAAAVARFEVASLASQMGFDPAETQDEDAVAIGQLFLERLNGSLEWADEPWIVSRQSGDRVRALTGPGTLDEPTWEFLASRFASLCSLFGNDGSRSMIGQACERAMVEWLPATAAPERRPRARAGRG